MQCLLYKIYFWKGFSYILQIDMHLICAPMLTKLYSCKKWVLQAGPRAFAQPRAYACALPAPTDRPAPPVSGTTARHCATAHPSDAYLPSLFPPATRARCTTPVSATLGLLPGAIRQSWPGPMSPPRRVAPPTPGPPPFPSSFPLCRAAFEPLAPCSHCSTRPPISTPLRPLLSSARASPPLPAPGPPPPATGSPPSLVDSGRAPPSSAAPW
jgi:hypothetical protein